jgi:site-specific DNA-methyltransferase (adenine-specific)
MWLREAFRIIQPGGMIKAFSGSRTSHRLAAAMAKAGFVDLQIIPWAYASGFPKSLNISKKIDEIILAKRTRFLLKALAKMGVGLESVEWVPDADPEKTTEIRVPLGKDKGMTLYRVEDNVFVQHPFFKPRDKKILSAEDTSFRNWAASENAEEGWSRPWIEQARKDGFYEVEDDNPVTSKGAETNGWGTALKPAYEPVVVGIKPGEKDKYAGIPPWELL